MVLKNANKTSPISGIILDIIGVYLIITFILCILLNATLIILFARIKRIRTSLNFLIFLMTVFNLIGALAFPTVIHGHFYRR